MGDGLLRRGRVPPCRTDTPRKEPRPPPFPVGAESKGERTVDAAGAARHADGPASRLGAGQLDLETPGLLDVPAVSTANGDAVVSGSRRRRLRPPPGRPVLGQVGEPGVGLAGRAPDAAVVALARPTPFPVKGVAAGASGGDEPALGMGRARPPHPIDLLGVFADDV